MSWQVDIQDKNSVYLKFDIEGANEFVDVLNRSMEFGNTKVSFGDFKNYRGKRLRGLSFIIAEIGQYVSFVNGILEFTMEKETVEDLVFLVTRAVEEQGFQTSELISLLPKKEKDVSVTLYGDLLISK